MVFTHTLWKGMKHETWLEPISKPVDFPSEKHDAMAVCQNPGTAVVHIKIAGIYGCSSL